MVPSESALQKLSNEWSCQYVLTMLIFLGNICVPPLVTEVNISPKELNHAAMQKADQMQKKMSHHYIIDACN
jgi:hypothetical protein